jgi:radical SAM protein with 4Fe4S-binding SPASM domain
MSKSFVSSCTLPEFSIWDRIKNKRFLSYFNLEITARCNNNCRHCFINLPAGDIHAKKKEISVEEISRIADEAVSLGALWCVIGGGEPFLREDFSDIYLALKKKGLLVVVYTNANLITEKHIELFKKYPPRNFEVTVYGVTRETYENVTRKPGSYDSFRRGLELLLKNGIKVRLKAMALRSNLSEMSRIAQFCRERTCDYFRFDPFLNLRYDGNKDRNKEIESERLSPLEIVALEKSDKERYQIVQEKCEKILTEGRSASSSDFIFRCGVGSSGFDVSYDGFFRLCTSLWHPGCLYDLKKGSLEDAWNHFVFDVLQMKSDNQELRETCRVCPLIDICFWCPANAHLERGELDKPVDYFCRVAQAKAVQYKGIDKVR